MLTSNSSDVKLTKLVNGEKTLTSNPTGILNLAEIGIIEVSSDSDEVIFTIITWNLNGLATDCRLRFVQGEKYIGH